MGPPFKLLIIDDNPEVLDALSDFFSQKKHHVLTASNGLDGLKLLEAQNKDIDIVITDIIMPHISGVAIITIIKKKFPEIPVVAITGWGVYPETMAAEAQADVVLEKPFDLNRLEAVVHELIAQKGR